MLGTVEHRLVWQMRLPGDVWRDNERIGALDDLRDQLRGLLELEADGEPVRGMRIEMRVVGLWEEVAA